MHPQYVSISLVFFSSFAMCIHLMILFIVFGSIQPFPLRVCIRNINRKQYVHLEGDVLNTNETIPWGEDAMLTLVFFPEGKYALQASNGKYLATSGALKDNADADTRYIIEFFSAQIAFKGNNNRLSKSSCL